MPSVFIDDMQTVLEFLNNLWGARNRVRIGLSYRPAIARICKPLKEPRNRSIHSLAARYDNPTFEDRPARLHRLEESIPWN
jgi:hypothetical protein